MLHNLVVNAIILWNTVYLSRAVNFVPDHGVHIQDRLLAQVAPIPWGHIGITGDYLWNEIDQPLERFRPLRANRFNQRLSTSLKRVLWNKSPRSPEMSPSATLIFIIKENNYPHTVQLFLPDKLILIWKPEDCRTEEEAKKAARKITELVRSELE